MTSKMKEHRYHWIASTDGYKIGRSHFLNLSHQSDDGFGVSQSYIACPNLSIIYYFFHSDETELFLKFFHENGILETYLYHAQK